MSTSKYNRGEKMVDRTPEQIALLKETFGPTEYYKNIFTLSELSSLISMYDEGAPSPTLDAWRIVQGENAKKVEVLVNNKFPDLGAKIGNISLCLFEQYFPTYESPLSLSISCALDNWGMAVVNRIPYKSLYIPLQVNYDFEDFNKCYFVTTNQYHVKDDRSVFTVNNRYTGLRYRVARTFDDLENKNTDKTKSIFKDEYIHKFLPSIDNEMYSIGMKAFSKEAIYQWEPGAVLVKDMLRVFADPRIETGVISKLYMRINTYRDFS